MIPARLLVIGGSGMLGAAATRYFAALGVEVVAPPRAQLDLTRSDDITHALATLTPDTVLNCAGFADVDGCEREVDRAFAVNGAAVGDLARACDAHDIPLVHISTDYVFAGPTSSAWREDDLPAPRSAYGRSKLAGEHALKRLPARWLLVRSGWLYGVGGKQHFVRQIQQRIAAGAPFGVVDDQLGSPTSCRELCRQLAALLAGDHRGVFHAAAAGEVSRYGWAAETARLLGGADPVTRCVTADYPTRAPRPPRSTLDTAKLTAATGCVPRPWQRCLADYLSEAA